MMNIMEQAYSSWSLPPLFTTAVPISKVQHKRGNVKGQEKSQWTMNKQKGGKKQQNLKDDVVLYELFQ